MTNETPLRLLLGPQRPTINLPTAIEASGLAPASLAVISAGWQEAEGDIDDVRGILGLPLSDLRLYHRAEAVFTANPDIEAAYRARQDRLQEQQRFYRLRLRQLAIAARETLRAEGDAEVLAAEQRHAIAQLRALDRHHLRRTEMAHAAFEAAYPAAGSPDLATHRAEIAAVIEAADGVLITGGNVIVLLNRMRLFGLADLLAGKSVIAWSAGAMALAGRIVLFHDRMPQGRRDAELLGTGLGLIDGHLFFPDPQRRLRKHDRLRVGFLSRRFAPDACVALDSGASVEFRGSLPQRADAAERLTREGRFKRLRAA